MCVRIRGQSPGGQRGGGGGGAHPGIHSLTWFNPGLNYMLIQCLLHVLKQIHLKTEYKSSALREVIFQCFQFVDLFLTAN